MSFVLRRAVAADAPFLAQMLAVAAFWRSEDAHASAADVMSLPDLAHYIAGWPRPGDLGVVAEIVHPVGGAWLRYLPSDDPGFGFVDAGIPELCMGVVARARGRGIGAALLSELISAARAGGTTAISLSVEPDNHARRLYERFGFEQVSTGGGALTMLCRMGPAVIDPAVDFRPLVPGDLALLRQWLAQPHVARWWNHETSPEAVERDFGPAIRGEEPSEDFVALLGGEPLGLIQRHWLRDYPDELAELRQVLDVPRAALTIDYLLGDVARTGSGVGTAMIGAMVARCWADVPEATCVIVPVVAGNVASWRALEKAGFDRVATGELAPDNPIDPPDHVVYRVDRPG